MLAAENKLNLTRGHGLLSGCIGSWMSKETAKKTIILHEFGGQRSGQPVLAQERSKGQHKAAAERDREATISQAIESIKTGRASLNITGVKHDIPKGTLYGRAYPRRKNRQLVHEDEQSLRPPEEDELLCWLRELDAWGLHLRRHIVMHRAEAILSYRAEKYGLDTPTHLGVNWFSHFTRRHPNVQTALSQLKDVSRSQAERDPIGISKFYSNLEHAYAAPYNIRPENWYNCEEKGVPRMTVLHNRPTVPQGDLPSLPRGNLLIFLDGNCEIVTVMDCICAGDGTVLPPFIIMKGKRPSYAWAKDSKLGKAWIAASPNGWTDNELGIAWLQKCFNQCTQEKKAVDEETSAGDTGIYPFNKNKFPFMREYYEKETEPVADPQDHASPPATPNISTCHDIIDCVRSMAAVAPDSPSAAIVIAQQSTYLLERADARITIQGIEGIGTKPVKVEAEIGDAARARARVVAEVGADEAGATRLFGTSGMSLILMKTASHQAPVTKGLPQIVSDPSEDELGEKENDRRTSGYKQRAEEPVEDEVR
ncbi:hypothetical protein C8R45DRAFT_923201 [Mycena sanguinolenta]|nr:hypothetical protein C8R45DRAFT_923201 [Mycena sanguinolenta]